MTELGVPTRRQLQSSSRERTIIGSNKSLGCIFSKKPADLTNTFKLKISSMTDFYDVLLHGQVWVKNDSKVPGRIREGDVMRAKSNRIREGNGRRFQGRRKEKSCFVVVQFELIFGHLCFHVVCACIAFFGEVGPFTERSGFLELCAICEKLMVFTEWLAMILECRLRRQWVPELSPETHHTWAVMVTKTSYWPKRTDICL